MSDLNKEEIGKRIKALRTQQGLTMEQFGEIFDPPASKSIVSRWEKGKSIPSNERLQTISNKYGISTFKILYGTESLVKIANIKNLDYLNSIDWNALDHISNTSIIHYIKLVISNRNNKEISEELFILSGALYSAIKERHTATYIPRKEEAIEAFKNLIAAIDSL